MQLILKHLAADFVLAGIRDDFPWSDYDPYPVLGERSDDTEFQLLKISQRGRVAFAIGCAAWVLAMRDEGERADEAWAYLDATWLCQISDRFVTPEAPADSPEWEGRRWGPIHLALITIENCFAGLEEENSEIDASFAELVPAHITSHPSAFRNWRSRFLSDLEATSPVAETEGEPIPAELLAMSGKPVLDPEQSLKIFAERVARSNNPFVREL